MGRLRDGARGAAQQGDPITAFLYRQLIMCLLAHTSGTWDGQQTQQAQQAAQQGATPLQQEGSGGSAGLAVGVATPSADEGTPARCAQDSSELPSLDGASSQAAGSSSDPSLSPPRLQQQAEGTPEPQGSEAARFRQLMDTWQAGRGSPAPAPSTQQAPEPPGSATQPASPLSGEGTGETCGVGSAGAACGASPFKMTCVQPGLLHRRAGAAPGHNWINHPPNQPPAAAEDTLCSLLAAFQVEEEEPLRRLDPADTATVVSLMSCRVAGL